MRKQALVLIMLIVLCLSGIGVYLAGSSHQGTGQSNANRNSPLTTGQLAAVERPDALKQLPSTQTAASTIDKQSSGQEGGVIDSKSGQSLLRPGVAAKQVDLQSYFLTNDGNDQGVDANAVGRALKSSNFSEVVDSLESQSAGDATIVQMNQLYRDTMLAQLRATGPEMTLNNFACGLQLCMGEIDDGGDASLWQAWEDRFDADPSIPHTIFSELEYKDSTGAISHRFVFSTDPKVKALHDTR